MAKKNKQNKKVVGINDIKNKENDPVVIENVDDAQEMLSRSLVEALTEQLIDGLSEGFERPMLALIEDDIADNAYKLLKNEITNDQYQENIGRVIIHKLAPDNRVYTDNDVTKLIELGESLTMKKLENIGISKKELREHVGIFAEYMHNQYGFIKERLQNTVYKFLRDNWKLERKVLDTKLRNLILEESHKHLDETKDERITTISKDLGNISVDSIFTVDNVTTDKLIDQSKEMLEKVATGEMSQDDFKNKFREGIRRLEEAQSTLTVNLAKKDKVVMKTIGVPRTASAISVIDDHFDSIINAAKQKFATQASAN